MRRWWRSCLAPVVTALVLTGCELEEINVVEVQEVVIAEIYVNLAEDPADNIASALLHRTVGLPDREFQDLTDAVVTMRRSDGYTFALNGEPTEDCIESTPEIDPGACFTATTAVASIQPGDLLEVRVDLPGGGVIEGAARLPGGNGWSPRAVADAARWRVVTGCRTCRIAARPAKRTCRRGAAATTARGQVGPDGPSSDARRGRVPTRTGPGWRRR